MKIQISKIIKISAFMLVLCLTMPYISSIVYAYGRDIHVHFCHDKEHDSCSGTKECCKICQNFINVKNLSSYDITPVRLSSAPTLTLSFFIANFEFHYIPYISLVYLKVRLNN
jgi:hypothetical protein